METYHQATHAYQELLTDYPRYYISAYSGPVLARNQYASLLCKIGMSEEAEEVNRENFTACKTTLGQINQITCNALQGLAFVLAQHRPDPAHSSNQWKQFATSAMANESAEGERRRQEGLGLRQEVVEIKTTLFGQGEKPVLRAKEDLA